jgi:hypothetical protein
MKKPIIILCLSISFLVGLTLLAFVYESKIVKIKSTNINFNQRQPFPDLETDNLSKSQIKLVNILKSEYNKQPKSYDQNMLKYSQGVEEPWCTDFVSWVYAQADMPFKNPHSGSWQIPGTQTLKQYFRDQGSWHDYNPSYQPKTGDVVIYKQFQSPFGQHTNIVLSNKNGELTTIGGNENREVRIQNFKISDQMGIDGYGELKNPS